GRRPDRPRADRREAAQARRRSEGAARTPPGGGRRGGAAPGEGARRQAVGAAGAHQLRRPGGPRAGAGRGGEDARRPRVRRAAGVRPDAPGRGGGDRQGGRPGEGPGRGREGREPVRRGAGEAQRREGPPADGAGRPADGAAPRRAEARRPAEEAGGEGGRGQEAGRRRPADADGRRAGQRRRGPAAGAVEGPAGAPGGAEPAHRRVRKGPPRPVEADRRGAGGVESDRGRPARDGGPVRAALEAVPEAGPGDAMIRSTGARITPSPVSLRSPTSPPRRGRGDPASGRAPAPSPTHGGGSTDARGGWGEGVVRTTRAVLLAVMVLGFASLSRADVEVAPPPREVGPDGKAPPAPTPEPVVKSDNPAETVEKIIKNSKAIADRLARTDTGADTRK